MVLIPLYSDWPKFYGILAVLSTIGLMSSCCCFDYSDMKHCSFRCFDSSDVKYCSFHCFDYSDLKYCSFHCFDSSDMKHCSFHIKK